MAEEKSKKKDEPKIALRETVVADGPKRDKPTDDDESE